MGVGSGIAPKKSDCAVMRIYKSMILICVAKGFVAYSQVVCLWLFLMFFHLPNKFSKKWENNYPIALLILLLALAKQQVNPQLLLEMKSESSIDQFSFEKH